jgi:hypothetical protein
MTLAQEQKALAMWRAGKNTYDIGVEIDVDEWVVERELRILRELSKQRGGMINEIRALDQRANQDRGGNAGITQELSGNR